MRNTYLVTYDIRDDKRLRQVFKAMRDFGDHLQYSVFECQFTPTDLARCRHVLGELINHAEDQVLFSPSAMNARKGPRYGALSRRPFDEMLAGARVDVASALGRVAPCPLDDPCAPSAGGTRTRCWGRSLETRGRDRPRRSPAPASRCRRCRRSCPRGTVPRRHGALRGTPTSGGRTRRCPGPAFARPRSR